MLLAKSCLEIEVCVFKERCCDEAYHHVLTEIKLRGCRGGWREDKARNYVLSSLILYSMSETYCKQR